MIFPLSFYLKIVLIIYIMDEFCEMQASQIMCKFERQWFRTKKNLNRVFF
jgi:hypothetical protein